MKCWGSLGNLPHFVSINATIAESVTNCKPLLDALSCCFFLRRWTIFYCYLSFLVEYLVCLICWTNLASSDWDCCMLWNISYNRVVWGFTISYFGLHSCYSGELCGSALYYGLHVGLDGSSFRELHAFGGMVSLTKLLDSVVGLLRMLIRLTFATLPCVVCRRGSLFFFLVNKKWLRGIQCDFSTWAWPL